MICIITDVKKQSSCFGHVIRQQCVVVNNSNVVDANVVLLSIMTDVWAYI